MLISAYLLGTEPPFQLCLTHGFQKDLRRWEQSDFVLKLPTYNFKKKSTKLEEISKKMKKYIININSRT